MTAIINTISILEDQVTSKICSKCGMIKPAHTDYFQKRNGKTKDGFRNHCKKCLKRRYAKYHIDNREAALKRAKKYTENNKEKVNNYQAQYRADNKEKSSVYFKKHAQDNKEKIAEYKKEYHKKNRCMLRKKHKEYWAIQENRDRRNKSKAIKYRTDPRTKLNHAMSAGIRHSLVNGSKCRMHWEDLVDFTVEQLERKLKKNIPAGYTWDDYMAGKLHLDHINPISKHTYETPEDGDFRDCWSLKNFQLLEAIENIKKGNKITKPFQMGLIFG